jgi:thiamine transporter
VLLEIAIFAAIAVVFNHISNFLPFWPNGGSITLVMVPIALIAFRRGLLAGVCTGLLTGILLALLSQNAPVHPVQVLLDYPIAFAALGVAGFSNLARLKGKVAKAIWAGVGLVIAGLLRFAMHFTSGVIFFAQYAPKGQSVYLYSFLYNIGYILPEIIIATIVMTILLYSAPQLLEANDHKR